MSFRTALDRRVRIQVTGPVTTNPPPRDRYGNQVRVAATMPPLVRARRDQLDATEDRTDRDQQARTFRYMLDLRDELGEEVAAPTGRDRIVDGDEVFEILGSPELVSRRRRPHHWELKTRKVEG